MPKDIILFSAPINFIGKENFNAINDYEICFIEIRTKEEIQQLKIKKDVVAWLVNPCPEFLINDSILNNFENLKVIVTPSTGKSHIDLNYCKANNIAVKGLLDSPVVKEITASSEFTLLLCLAAIRNLRAAFSSVTNGNWRNVENNLRGREISELKIGIIGFGRIGNNLANYFLSMGSEVFINDPYINYDSINNEIVICNEIDELLRNCDVIVTSVTLNESTKYLVNKDFINKMKDGVIYINTSRGDVVDESELLNALETGKISSCALDVLSGENKKGFLDNNKLVEYAKSNENLIITPHIAGLTIDSETKAQKAAFNLLTGVLKCQ